MTGVEFALQLQRHVHGAEKLRARENDGLAAEVAENGLGP